MSHSGRKIRENLIALCASGAELAHLLRLYKDSFFYNDEFQIDIPF
jgi:hypothetical protein